MKKRIVIACDKFKGSLTSSEVCESLASGLSQLDPDLVCIPFPLADGGEGTTEILVRHTQGRIIEKEAHDPLMRPVMAYYGISGDGKTAFIEMSVASGLHLLDERERSVMETSTYGTGELMGDAVNHGVDSVFVGIGGSATNDAAIGAAAALGYAFLNGDGTPVVPIGKNLQRIETIDRNHIHPSLHKTRITALCDVDNPFFGRNGAAWVYGPQKGASEDEVLLLDAGLEHLCNRIRDQMGIDISQLPGAGGGGGFGGGCVAFFGADLQRGIETVLTISGFERLLMNADIVITGEGKMDVQTMRGKVVSGVAEMARRYNKPLIGVTGINQLNAEEAKELGLQPVLQLTDFAPLSASMAKGKELLKNELARKLYEAIKNESYSR